MLDSYRPASGTTPFRNGFRSFLTALQFGLTLGGGGTDSADCEFEIKFITQIQDDDESLVIFNVEGMDVLFSIYGFYTCESKVGDVRSEKLESFMIAPLYETSTSCE